MEYKSYNSLLRFVQLIRVLELKNGKQWRIPHPQTYALIKLFWGSLRLNFILLTCQFFFLEGAVTSLMHRGGVSDYRIAGSRVWLCTPLMPS